MRTVFSLCVALVFAGSVCAQSGRVKITPTPTPKPISGPSVLYMPTQAKPDATTSEAKKNKAEADDIIKVESALVPIPVSVVDKTGHALSGLSMSDFDLKVDGKSVEIGDLARSE